MDSDKAYLPAETTVMLLAAGRGQRMGKLTEDEPKPLLKIGDHSLIEHHLKRLANAGFKNIVINLAYRGQQIVEQLSDGTRFGLNITYSDESDSGALETAGGIIKALPFIQSDPFLVVNADIWTDFDFLKLLTPLHKMARLVLVENPKHNINGDFYCSKKGELSLINQGLNKKTFSGLAIYKKAMFTDLNPGKQALAPILTMLIKQQQAEGLIYTGNWEDVGTPIRLAKINKQLNQQLDQR